MKFLNIQAINSNILIIIPNLRESQVFYGNLFVCLFFAFVFQDRIFFFFFFWSFGVFPGACSVGQANLIEIHLSLPPGYATMRPVDKGILMVVLKQGLSLKC